MPRAATIPADSDLLCEACGYTLNGVDPAGRCPECGKPISDSRPELRQLAPWENRSGRSALGAWFSTAGRALFRPKAFFRQLAISGDAGRARVFGFTQRLLAAVLLGLAVWIHASEFGVLAGRLDVSVESWFALPILIGIAWFFAAGVTRLVTRLTAFEAGYRGLRLPRVVVNRAMDYHAVHLLPPAALGLAITGGYAVLLHRKPEVAANWVLEYHYVLAGAVVVSAGYLFKTYWTAMRNLMYGNR